MRAFSVLLPFRALHLRTTPSVFGGVAAASVHHNQAAGGRDSRLFLLPCLGKTKHIQLNYLYLKTCWEAWPRAPGCGHLHFLRSNCLVKAGDAPNKNMLPSFENSVCTDRHEVIRVSIKFVDYIMQC